jgi:uncharacterized protein
MQSRWSALTSSLVLGVIWGLWHLPLHFMNGTTQQYIPIWAGIVLIVVGSILYTWLHNNTGGSILVAMLFHWTGNIGGMILPYWQLGLFGDTMPSLPNLLTPNMGMLIGFGVYLVAAILVVVIWGSRRLSRQPIS